MSETGLHPPPNSLSTACSKVSLLQFFVYASMVSYVAFVLSLFLLSPLCTPGRLYFMIVAFREYNHLTNVLHIHTNGTKTLHFANSLLKWLTVA